LPEPVLREYCHLPTMGAVTGEWWVLATARGLKEAIAVTPTITGDQSASNVRGGLLHGSAWRMYSSPFFLPWRTKGMSHLFGVVGLASMGFFFVSHVAAQETCLLYQRGTVDCPAYGAPAATAVPGPSMDGVVTTVPSGSSTTLFGGKVPPNGFMIRVFVRDESYLTGTPPTLCFVNDNGPAGVGAGFLMIQDLASGYSATFASPHGYKPIGPVNIYCQSSITVNVVARGW
jgi:hypothetical protein